MLKIFFIAVTLSDFFPFTVGLFVYKYFDKPLRIVYFLITTSFILSVLSVYYAIVYKNNLWTLHIYTLVEFFFLSIFYYNLFESSVFKRIVILLMVIFTIMVTVNKIFLETIDKLDNYSLTLSAILILIISSMYLVDYLSKNLIVRIRDYRFLLTITYMMYFGGNIFVFALSNEIKEIWIIHNLIHIALVMIYIMVFLWQRSARTYGG